MGTYKVNVSLPEELVGKIDEAAAALGTSRSGFIAEASARYITDVRELTEAERRSKDIRRAIDGFKRIRESTPVGYEFDYVAQIRADRERDTPEGFKR
ncbi:MAG: type II toxin-antitoxin system HicB family antitoxin [Coriobacteriia bacterium]|nr:type II toxin-antitoxin system HicB family antitoxin [Coriobacteriia bacterium]